MPVNSGEVCGEKRGGGADGDEWDVAVLCERRKRERLLCSSAGGGRGRGVAWVVERARSRAV